MAPLRPGQYRVAAVGFCVPVACAGWGVGVPVHALLSPSLSLFAYVVSVPPLAPIAWMQFRLWRAVGLPDGPARRTAMSAVRRLMWLPFLLTAAGVTLAVALLISAPPSPPGVPLHALLVASLVITLIGACALPFAARARSDLLPLAGGVNGEGA